MDSKKIADKIFILQDSINNLQIQLGAKQTTKEILERLLYTSEQNREDTIQLLTELEKSI